jgi:hypothetical protein
MQIGDISLRLPPPPGYCEMDPVLASDVPLFARIHATIAKKDTRRPFVWTCPGLVEG